MLALLLPMAMAWGEQSQFPATSPAQTDRGRLVAVEKVPHIELPEHSANAAGDVAAIKGLISLLGNIDKPDFGLSPMMSGSAFAPLPDLAEVSTFVFGANGTATNLAFLKLVELGPKALPFLLAALDDKRPTKLTMDRFMWTSYGRELSGNPANKAESAILASLPQESDKQPANGPESYTVTVGDVCFVIIGQIVGRPYSAIRYQPSGGLVINSPTHDPLIAKAVRRIWSSTNPRQHLIDSLLFDFCTRGVTQRTEDWTIGYYVASRLQISAVARMLYYFPDQTAALVADRIANLHVKDTRRPTYSDKETPPNTGGPELEPNGVRTDHFLKAAAWCIRPEIQSALACLFQKADDPYLAVACLSPNTTVPPYKIQSKLAPLLMRHADEIGPFGICYKILVCLGKYCGPEVKRSFREFLCGGIIVRVRAVIYALREVRQEWAAELLGPFLVDKRDFGWDYAANPDNDEQRLPIRICDEAAETIAMTNKSLHFEMVGTHANLDKQIRAIRSSIQAKSGG